MAPLHPPANLGGPPHDTGSAAPQGDEDIDAISLHPRDAITPTPLPREKSKYRVFQDTITKPSDNLASPLQEDIASCFNATYHTSLSEASEDQDLLTTTLHPANINMIIKPLNNGLFSLKDPAMHAIRRRDSQLQEAQVSLVKSSYITMKLAEDLAQAHSEGQSK